MRADELPDDFESFYRATHPRLWAYLLASSGNRALAEDSAQEAFVRLMASRARNLPPTERRAYLFRIGDNLMRDEYRRRKRDRGYEVQEAPSLELEAQAPSFTLAAQALRAASPQQRRLLWLAYVEGWTHAEIARCLGLASASVRVLLHRARHRVAAALNRQPSDEPEP